MNATNEILIIRVHYHQACCGRSKKKFLRNELSSILDEGITQNGHEHNASRPTIGSKDHRRKLFVPFPLSLDWTT